MITQQKIKIYNSYRGDIDKWVRIGSKKEKSIMTDEDWAVIAGLLQDILLVEKGLASVDFTNTLQKRLAENCDTSETIRQLKREAENQSS